MARTVSTQVLGLKHPAEWFYIIDGHSLLYRSFHAPMANLWCKCPECDGKKPKCEWCGGEGREYTKATFGFCKTIMKLCREMNPAYLCIAMDAPRKTLVRKTIDPTYKGTRKGMPAELLQQKARIKQIMRALGIPMFLVKGWEADDVIGTLARRFVSDDVGIRIVSQDHDLWQLLDDERIEIYSPGTAEVIGKHDVYPNYGVKPENVIAYKALAGDTGDNVKGVEGVGDKTAIQWLDKYGSLAAILKQRKMIPGKMGERLCAAYKDGTIARCEKLVTLNCDLKLDVEPGALEFNGLNWNKARPLFRLLKFKRWENL